MQIKKIRVEELLDTFDYELDLKLDDVATIIHAPNGYGKTTFLSLINAVFSLGFDKLANTSFDNIAFSFVDKSKLIVTKSTIIEDAEGDTSREEACLTFRFTDTEGNQEIQEIKTSDLEINTRFLRENTPWLQRVSPHTWRDRRDGSIIGRSELIELYGSEISEGSALPKPWLRKLFENNH